MAKPPIDALLIDTALQPELCRRLLECPDEVFKSYDLTENEKDILRRPDHRLLPLLGTVLVHQMKSPGSSEEAPAVAPAPFATIEARTLPDTLMALTVVPCAIRENGQFKGISYVVWMNPLPAGIDPATLPQPIDAVFPGQPLAPLHAVIQISAVLSPDPTGAPQVGLWGSFQQSTNVRVPLPPETAGEVEASPFKSPQDSAQVQAAAAAVRNASREEKYDRLVDLLHVLHRGDVR